jgi:hypothetical protein
MFKPEYAGPSSPGNQLFFYPEIIGIFGYVHGKSDLSSKYHNLFGQALEIFLLCPHFNFITFLLIAGFYKELLCKTYKNDMRVYSRRLMSW